MAKYTIKNKTSGKQTLPDGYQYLINVIPPSLNDVKFGYKNVGDSNISRIDECTNAIKYRDLHLFEVLMMSSFFVPEYTMPLFVYRNIYFGSTTIFKYLRKNYTNDNRVCRVIDCEGIAVYSPLGLPESPHERKDVDYMARFVMCDPYKYEVYDIDNIIENIFKHCKMGFERLIFSDSAFLTNRDYLVTQHSDTLTDMKRAIQSNDFDTFNELAYSLEIKDYRDEALKADNITFDFSNTNAKINIPSKNLNVYQFYEALLQAHDDVLVTAYSKNYHYYKTKKPNVRAKKIQYIDTFKVYFTNTDDVDAFMSVYKHSGCVNNASMHMLLPLPTSSASKSKKPVVYRYVSDHIKLFNDKLKNSSMTLDISERKTPFKKINGSDVHGYLELSSIILKKDFTEDDEDDIAAFIEKTKQHFSKLGFDDNILFHPSITVWNTTRIRNSGVLYNINDSVSVLAASIATRYGLYNCETLTQCFDLLKHKRETEDMSPFMYSLMNNKAAYSAISMRIPIFMDEADNVKSLLKLLNRQKLTGKIGNVSIQSIQLAPYATNSSDHTENIIDAISVM